MEVTERVPLTGLGGTQVRWKQHEVMISGSVSQVMATASIVDSGKSFGIKLKCGADGCTPKEIKYKDKVDKVIKSSVVLTERTSVNICSGFKSKTWVNYTAQTGHWTECDPRTGVISEHSKALKHTIYPPGGILP